MPNHDKQWAKRKRIERRIIAKLVMDAINDGFVIDVFDGEAFPLKASTNPDAILKSLWTVDEERLYLTKPGTRGWVFLVHGNDGWDVICDYTTNLEDVLKGANAIAEKASDDDK